MNLPNLRQAKLDGKRVLMRVDFNVGFNNKGKPKGHYKIEAARKSIEYILSKPGVKLALLSHLDRPQKREEEFSFKNKVKSIGNVLGHQLVFVDDCVGDKVREASDNMKEGQVLLLENVRFCKEDVEGKTKFAKKLAENFDIYINDAFGVAHRDHASLTKIIKHLPSFAGLNLQKEVRELAKLRSNFRKPAVAIIGGVKIETKILLIDFFAENYDIALLGSKISLEAQANKIKFSENVIIPQDYRGQGLDIGPKTVKEFMKIIKKAKTVVWNGPLGMFEVPGFAIGTFKILEAIIGNKYARKVAGGGETLQALEENNLIEEFNFVSTGGGAMLDFLTKGTLPVLEALYKKRNN